MDCFVTNYVYYHGLVNFYHCDWLITRWMNRIGDCTQYKAQTVINVCFRIKYRYKLEWMTVTFKKRGRGTNYKY